MAEKRNGERAEAGEVGGSAVPALYLAGTNHPQFQFLGIQCCLLASTGTRVPIAHINGCRHTHIHINKYSLIEREGGNEAAKLSGLQILLPAGKLRLCPTLVDTYPLSEELGPLYCWSLTLTSLGIPGSSMVQ